MSVAVSTASDKISLSQTFQWPRCRREYLVLPTLRPWAASRIGKLYRGNATKSASWVGLRPFFSGVLSLKRSQLRLGAEHVRSSDIAGSNKFELYQLHLANRQAWPEAEISG